MQERDFVEQLAELATRVNRIERWQEQWRTRNRKVAGLQADTVRASGGYLLTATQGLAANLHRELTPASNTYTSGWHLLADFSPANGYHSIIPTWWELPGKQNDVVCEVSTVTVFPAEAPHNVMYHAGDPRNLLTVVADTMSTLGNVQAYVMGDTFVVLGPEHARIMAGAGWSKRDVRMFLSRTPGPRSAGFDRADLLRETNVELCYGPGSSTLTTTPRWCPSYAVPRIYISWSREGLEARTQRTCLAGAPEGRQE